MTLVRTFAGTDVPSGRRALELIVSPRQLSAAAGGWEDCAGRLTQAGAVIAALPVCGYAPAVQPAAAAFVAEAVRAADFTASAAGAAADGLRCCLNEATLADRDVAALLGPR